MTPPFRTWIEISRRAIAHNYHAFRKLLAPGVKLLGVVKSNAYGHELMGFSRTLADLGIDFLGVDSITEANTLRKIGIHAPILVHGYTLPENFPLAAHHNIAITVSTLKSLTLLAKQKKRISIHLKLETGMNRQGFVASELAKAIKIITVAKKTIRTEGIYTHFGAAKRPDVKRDTEKQISRFLEMAAVVEKAGLTPLRHACATAGTLNYPEAHFDIVRVGIGLYGHWPSEETLAAHSGRFRLQPALTWKAIVSEVKWVEKGEKVGYDYTETLARRSRLAVIPIGYWHGYWRAFSSKAHVLIHGTRCRVVGRVSMDMIVVDTTDCIRVTAGDVAVLVGKNGADEITAGELAKIAGTTNYEILTRLNPLIKKYYI